MMGLKTFQFDTKKQENFGVFCQTLWGTWDSKGSYKNVRAYNVEKFHECPLTDVVKTELEKYYKQRQNRISSIALT